MTEIRMLAIDIDGTLVNSAQQITPRTLNALAAAQANGIELVIATGRRHTFALRMLPNLDLADDSVILSSNGAVVRQRNGQLIARTEMPTGLALALCAALGNFRDRLIFTFDLVDSAPLAMVHPGALLVESVDKLAQILGRWVEINRGDIVEAVPIEAGLLGPPPVQAMICGPIAWCREIESALLAGPLAPRMSLHRTEYASRDLCILDILPAHCSKGHALAALAKSRGILPAQVAAIGDNYNDAEMLEFAGHSVLMGNASQEMLRMARDHGWQVTETNDDEGVAQAVERLLGVLRP
jgi:hydroxymethylpyrimidine pyrophosphatase-like HAD family hydrolase